MARNKHPSKEIEKALQQAESQGWEIKEGGSHCWGELYCPTNEKCRGGRYCRMSIWSTPKNPQAHAKDLARAVSKCSAEDNNSS